MKGLLDFVPGNSIFHRMNPIAKLVFPMSICASCFISSSIEVLVFLILIDIVLGFLCGIPSRTWTLIKGLIKISIFLFVLQIIIIRGGTEAFRFYFFTITDLGLSVSLRLVLKLFGATLPLAIMLSVTKLADLSNALVEKIHIPYKYAFTLTTAIRFIPVFAQEMDCIIEAQKTRGIQLDTKNPIKKIALILPLCAPLLVSSVRKTSGSAIAADLRGFKLRKIGSSSKTYPYKVQDIILFVVSFLLLMGTILIAVNKITFFSNKF